MTQTGYVILSYLYENRQESIYTNYSPTVSEVMTVNQAPSVPSHAEFYPRVRSFTDWPKGSGIRVADLVKSGFYYLGYKDRVQCFQCGGMLENWKVGDDVDSEHARNLPHCPFIAAKRGQSFVDVIVKMDILASKCASAATSTFITREERSMTGAREKILQKSSMVSRTESPAQHREFPVSTSLQNVPTSTSPVNTFPVAPRDIRARLDTEMSRHLMELGYKKPLLALVIGDRLAQTGDDFPSFMDYFMAVKNAEHVLTGGTVDTFQNYHQQTIVRSPEPTVITS